MNAEAPGSAASPPQRPARRWLKLALISIGVLGVAVLVVQPWKAPPEQTFVWVSPAQFASAARPGPFTSLTYKVIRLTAPLWQRFRRPKRQILIEAQFVAIPAAVAPQGGLGPPAATNADGTLAWILSPADLTAFRKVLQEDPAATQLGRPRLITADGMRASVFTGQSLPGLGSSGLGVEVTATIASGTIKLLLKAQSTEPVESAPGNIISLKTNLAAACSVVMPDAGALVLLGANSAERSATNHWIIVSPATINSRGQPATPRAIIQRKS